MWSSMASLTVPEQHSIMSQLSFCLFVQQVTPLSYGIAVVPYPIPPAGADLSLWQPDEEPPPLTFSVTLSDNLLVPARLQVGWWDDRAGAWSQQGVR